MIEDDIEMNYIKKMSVSDFYKQLDPIKNKCHGFKFTDDGLKIFDASQNVIHKLNVITYHYYNYLGKELEYMKTAKEFSKIIKTKMGITYEPLPLIAEFEAFLFQIKACLDIFSKSIGQYNNQNPSNIKKLRIILLQSKKVSSKKILKILDKNIWLREFESENNMKKSMRDTIAHYQALNTSGIIVDNRQEHPLTGKPKRKQVNRSKIKSTSVTKIMDKYYNSLVNMVDEIYAIIYSEMFKKK